MNEQQIIASLHRLKRKHKHWKDVAKELGLSQGTVSDLLHGRRGPGPKVYAAFGEEVRQTYTTKQK